MASQAKRATGIGHPQKGWLERATRPGCRYAMRIMARCTLDFCCTAIAIKPYISTVHFAVPVCVEITGCTSYAARRFEVGFSTACREGNAYRMVVTQVGADVENVKRRYVVRIKLIAINRVTGLAHAKLLKGCG